MISTGGCSLLVLDEVLGLVDNEIITTEDLHSLLDLRGEMDVIMTGISIKEDICALADEVNCITPRACGEA